MQRFLLSLALMSLLLFSACQHALPEPTPTPLRLTERERLQLQLARMHFDNGDYLFARQEYTRLALNHPSQYVQEIAQFMIGESYFRDNDCPQAERYFQHYIVDFPTGYKRSESDVRLQECANRRSEAETYWTTARLRQQQAAMPEAVPTPAPTVAAPPVKRNDPRAAFRTTWYWIENEADYERKALTPLHRPNGETIATVPAAFLKRLRVEGTGRLTDGRIVNWVEGGFMVVDTAVAPYGYGARQMPLIPFRTLAVDRGLISLGTILYLKEFDGLQLENGRSHDGCFVAGDVGSAIKGYHVDLFAPSYKHALTMMQKLPERLAIHQAASHCQSAYSVADAL